MSSLFIPVAAIDDIKPHTNADSLELAIILGWQMVVKKGEYTKGDKVVYFPIDTVLPLKLSEKYGATKYLSKGRIRCARLRGEPSFGLAVKPEDEAWQVGDDLSEYYEALGVTKYEPPMRAHAGDAERDHQLFRAYTNIENMRNFPGIFQEGEPVILTEKVHGTNSRVGNIMGELMAGSKEVRRKRPEGDNFTSSLYWYPLSLAPVRVMLEDLGATHGQIVLYGEIYGSKIQSLHYGNKGSFGYRAFDLLIDGTYLNWQDVVALCRNYGVETVPVVAEIPFSLEAVKGSSEGNTLLMPKEAHMREGLVVRPLIERTDPKIGRCLLKYVSDTYLFGKQTDYADV